LSSGGSGTFVGNVTGNITGNVTGNVTGNLNSSGVSTITTLRTGAIQTVAGKPILNSTGSILQVVQTVDNVVSTTTSGTFNDTGSLSVTITPGSSSSKVLIIPDILCGGDGGLGVNYMFRLLRGGTVIYGKGAAGSQESGIFEIESSVSTAYDYQLFTCMRMFLDSPATTSATTYKIQWRVTNGGTITLNRNFVDTNDTTQLRGSSSITAMEVSA
jgi:hypothetical protein